MSHCPHRTGKCTFDYEMCLPSAQYKSSDTGVCLSRALLVPAQSQPPWLLFTVTSSSSGRLPSQSGADSNFLGCQRAFITTTVMDTPQIFPQQTPDFLRDEKGDLGRWFSKQLMKAPMSHLTGCFIQGSGERKTCWESVYSVIMLRVYSPDT